ncbi:hypothetical protein [uncultured Mediterranean phage uvMED]|nr:hypothetical protein [uncultured phage MedDCM-OCT-S04-C64]BAQ88894.1 hypothetical protein [uncultured Mediterranean phage uvMED]BAQ89112.1 hypothetical protein [uncultured Mediterranean phage uvMED]
MMNYGMKKDGSKKMNHDSKNFTDNKSQFLKNSGNFSDKGMKQMPMQATFSKISKKHT